MPADSCGYRAGLEKEGSRAPPGRPVAPASTVMVSMDVWQPQYLRASGGAPSKEDTGALGPLSREGGDFSNICL